MTNLTVSEERFHELLLNGEIQLDPPLSKEAIEKMRYNRNREYNHPEMKFLDNEKPVQKYSTYAKAAMTAKSRYRKLGFQELSEEELEEMKGHEETIRMSAVKMFSLLKPVLKYHEFWEEIDLDYIEIAGDGLKQLEEFEDSPEQLHVDDAFSAVQEMRTVAVGIGLLYDNQEEVLGAMEEMQYWQEEFEEAEQF